ncbi:MAG: adenylosuccinate lyase [Nitrospirales bacterium]|nr:adenylosuccinate lyase [Nitrospirales bacterium]MDR4482468.1 adenylosuccinate lyase [Nitrospirales bacterium]
MIDRYTLPRMGTIWTQTHKYELWLQVELAVCEAMEQMGQVPQGVAARIRKKVTINSSRIAAIEEVTKHDVIAFLESVAEQAGKDGRFLHAGLTSSDIVDTSLALQLVEAAQLIREDVRGLLKALQDLAFAHQDTLMVGRSHGIHGEPISFAWKVAIWYQEFQRQQFRLEAAIADIAVGKLSGAMGTFAHLSPAIEKAVCQRLGLKPAPISNQIIQRDRHAAFLSTLALIAASIEKVATEIRHLQRTEVLEAEEFFEPGQKGSSAMPHKRNPISSENLCGLARVVRSNSLAAMENVALWHERDISHSSAERIILPDSTILIDYMLVRLTKMVSKLVVYPQRMMATLNQTGGLIYSQRLLLALVDKGAIRKDAYEHVQQHAMAAWKGKGSFQDLIVQDPFIAKHLSMKEIATCFNPKAYLRYQQQIFARVFGKHVLRKSSTRTRSTASKKTSTKRNSS